MGNSPPRRASASSPASRELERFSNPTGLYPTCPWDVRMARRLIVDKRIAPRFPGRDCKESCFTQECPICFMFYPGNLNMSTCCKKPICSECYLQLKPPKKNVSCPYCNNEAFGIKYTAPAVINLSSIYSDQTPPSTPEYSRPAPASSTTTTTTISTISTASDPVAVPMPPAAPPTDHSLHFASAEDRARIRDDLRSQLNLTDRPITTPLPRSSISQSTAPPARLTASASFIIASAEDAARHGEPRYIIASATDAARLEEMMMMEAIRRSMADLTTAKDEENERNANAAAASASAAPAVVPSPIVRRPSTNPFDEVGSSAAAAAPPAQRRESASWNPFDE